MAGMLKTFPWADYRSCRWRWSSLICALMTWLSPPTTRWLRECLRGQTNCTYSVDHNYRPRCGEESIMGT